MADLHPEVLKMIEAGPQRCSTCPMCKGSGKRVSRGFTGNEATHGCRICNATGRMVETPEEFARRIALRQQELDREDVDAILCALITKDELARMKDRLEAIRRRGES